MTGLVLMISGELLMRCNRSVAALMLINTGNRVSLSDRHRHRDRDGDGVATLVWLFNAPTQRLCAQRPRNGGLRNVVGPALRVATHGHLIARRKSAQ